MPRVPSTSPATGLPTKPHYIHTTDCNFVDNAGRTLLLRGVNLSGSSKAPVGRPSYILDGFWEVPELGGESFVGRPLNIDDGSADIHLARLKGWGFNLLRFPVTWEAIEHEGPGKYDYDYIEYTIRVLRKCKEYGFRVYMDPHQDTWSRFSGGSGAPYWTLPACGIDPHNITATQAAIIHCEYPLAHQPDPASLPAMIWSTNYGRLFSQTIFTLFFAGRDLAPSCVIDGQNIQDYLQSHYIEAMGTMADEIAKADGGSLLDECVIGWDSLNEPFEGLCGWEDINLNPTRQGSTLKKGTYPTPAQSLRLGMGQAQTVDCWKFGMMGPSRDGSVTIDPKGRKLWAEAVPDSNTTGEHADGTHPRWGWKRDVTQWPLGSCPWALHGVWDVETGFVLRPDYFRYNSAGEVSEFINDYWKPHWLAFSTRIRAAHPEAIIFVQPPVFGLPPAIEEADIKGRCAYSAHYYDGLTLVTRHWNWFNADALGLLRGKYSSPLQAVKIGAGAIRKSLQEQLGYLKADVSIFGEYPTVIGEIGTPFDMDGKRSYGWTDAGRYKSDYGNQEKALDASLNGADGVNGLSYTIWTYCPDHTHEWGDGWNMEDLSLWSVDDLRERKEVGDVEDVKAFWEGAPAESQAVLLKKGGYNKKYNRQQQQQQQPMAMESLAMRAAASSLSLATLGSLASSTGSVKNSNPSTTKNAAGWHSNPYDFLTDGARAVKAFARPYPTKVVGRPKDVKFDMAKGVFKLVVGVRAEDRVGGDLNGRGGDNNGSGENETKGERLATEVFVPLVHYAHPRLLLSTSRRQDGGGDTHSIASVDSLSSSASELQSNGSGETAVVDYTPALPAHDFPHPPAHRAVTGDQLVDVDVKVSGGRWAVEGQTLKWWYDVPSEGESEREYTIEVRRRGGVIKVKGEEGGYGDEEGGYEDGWRCCEKTCESVGCCVM